MKNKSSDIIKIENRKLRKMGKANSFNQGNRSLYQSLLTYELIPALKDFRKSLLKNKNRLSFILIGYCACAYYTKPRVTFDIDILIKLPLLKDFYIDGYTLLNVDDNYLREKHYLALNNKGVIPSYVFEHNITKVKLKVYQISDLNINMNDFYGIRKRASKSNGINILSMMDVIEMKSQRNIDYDGGDIEYLKGYFNI